MIEIMHMRIGVLSYLAPSGPFCDDEGISILLGKVSACLEQRETRLVLDLDRVPALNGAALEALLDIQDRLSRLGGQLKVVNANALVRDIFAATGFGNYVEVIDKSDGRFS